MAGDDKHQRVIVLDDDALRALIAEKGELVESGRAISREIDALEKQHDRLTNDLNILGNKVNAVKHRIFKRLRQIARNQLTEFEIPITTDIRNGSVVLIVTDALAEFQDNFSNFDKWTEAVPRKKKLAN